MKTKAVISVLLSLLLAFAMMPAAVFADEPAQDTIMLIFGIETAPAENGSVEISSTRGSTGSEITVTVTPDEGYALESIVLAGASGTEYELTDLGDGKYSFKLPSEEVTLTAVFAAVEVEPEPVVLPFEDVAETDIYYADICYVYAKNLMNGITDTLFAPNNYMTRAMAATVLARIDGLDTAADEDWTAAGLEWAIANGITDGSGMEDPITREQLLVMLYRFAAYKGIDVTVDETISLPGVSDWAAEAVSWVIENGYISAEMAGLIDVSAPATRGEAAMLFTRLCEALAAIEVPPVEEIPEETEETEAAEETEVVEETTEAAEETEVVEETTEAVEETEVVDETTEVVDETTETVETAADAE